MRCGLREFWHRVLRHVLRAKCAVQGSVGTGSAVVSRIRRCKSIGGREIAARALTLKVASRELGELNAIRLCAVHERAPLPPPLRLKQTGRGPSYTRSPTERTVATAFDFEFCLVMDRMDED